MKKRERESEEISLYLFIFFTLILTIFCIKLHENRIQKRIAIT